jgi:hypothetical protein
MSVNPQIQNVATPLLFHQDLHKRNVFVSENDPTIITGIIDWQAASIEPSFWYADEMPDFATSYEAGHDIYLKSFEACTQILIPRLSGPRLMSDGLFRPFRYSYRTWKDGAVDLHDDLIETAQPWKELGFTGQCPYPIPAPKELAGHKREYKLFEAAQNLKYDLASLLNIATDGWMPPKEWEAVQRAHKEMFEGMLHAAQGSDERRCG